MTTSNSSSTQHDFFLRPVSGLVRAAGFWDTLIFNIGLISIGVGAIYTQKFATAYYSDGSISLATVLAAIVLAGVVLGFLTWTIAIPRSGGIYVFLSRSGLPVLGFAASFVEVVSWLFYAAIAAKLVSSAALLPATYMFLGPEHILTQFVANMTGQFIVGTVIIIVCTMILTRGMSVFLFLQKVAFAFGCLGLVALLGVLAAESAHVVFGSNLEQLLHASGVQNLQTLLDAARSEQWLGRVPATFSGSFLLLVWPVLPLIGAVFSISIGGEIRNSARNQAWGMIGSLVVSTFLLVAIAEMSKAGIGENVQGASAYLVDLKKLHLGAAETNLDPNIVLLGALSTNNAYVRALIFLGFFSWIWFWVIGQIAYGQRAVLAWALDRIVPPFLGNLHTRFGTPYMAVIAAAVVSEIFLALITWTDFFATLVFVLAGAIAWGLALSFGVVFPYTRGALFGRTPLAAYGVRGKLMMSAACALGVIGMLIVITLIIRDPVAAGDLGKDAIVITSVFLLGIAIFCVSAWQRKTAGGDLRRAFEEIPVE